MLLSWHDIDGIVDTLARLIAADGIPDVIVGIQRGGLVPAVLLSHTLSVRALVPLDIRRTLGDEADAQKTEPVLGPPPDLAIVGGRDVIVVDDVMGSGATLRAGLLLLQAGRPLRMRSAVCVTNMVNWSSANMDDYSGLVTYCASVAHGWVTFPWERRSARFEKPRTVGP